MKDRWNAVPCSEKTIKARREDVGRLSMVMQHIERQLVEHVAYWLKNCRRGKRTATVADFQHDGVFVSGADASEIEGMFEEMERYVEDQTGIRIELSVKEMTDHSVEDLIEAEMQKKIDSPPTESIIGSMISDDTEGAELFAKYYEGKFAKCQGTFYTCCEDTHVWKEGADPMIKMVTRLELTLGPPTSAHSKGKPYSRTLSGAKKIVEMVKHLTDSDDEWMDRIHEQSRGLVFYNDMVWNILERRFEPFEGRSCMAGTGRDAPIQLFEEY